MVYTNKNMAQLAAVVEYTDCRGVDHRMSVLMTQSTGAVENTEG